MDRAWWGRQRWRGLGLPAALVAAGAVAGCSESSSDDIVRLGYDDLADQFDAIADANAELPITDPNALPLSGGATYDGVMVLSTNGDDGLPTDMAGDMTLRADFGSDTLSGSVDDVVTSDDDRLEGSLDIENGDIDRNIDIETTLTYGFDVNGTLIENDGTDLRVEASGVGDFLGEGHRQVAGDVEGEISSSEGDADLEGGFVGIR